MTEHKDGSAHSNSLRLLAGAMILVFAVGALAIGLIRELQSPDLTEHRASEEILQAATVYYFHGDVRCDTCLTIEAQSTEIVRRRFSDELQAGTLRLQVANLDTPAYAHYRQEFDLAFGTVVVRAAGSDAAWENLSDVWVLVHEHPDTFEQYLVDHITPFLEPIE